MSAAVIVFITAVVRSSADIVLRLTALCRRKIRRTKPARISNFMGYERCLDIQNLFMQKPIEQ